MYISILIIIILSEHLYIKHINNIFLFLLKSYIDSFRIIDRIVKFAISEILLYPLINYAIKLKFL